jgi:predicted glycoside hydrolase/deacetylase ChbG (UPF0249 family)
MSKKLIVNGDDFGVNKYKTDAIIFCSQIWRAFEYYCYD